MTAATPASRGPHWRRVLFVVLMLGLTVLFAALGVWQWQRMGEKEALITAVTERTGAAPVVLPLADAWPTLEASLEYRPVTATGRFVPEDTVLVFTSLAEPRGQYRGPGYWVVTPLVLEDGGTVFVNRGFIPQARRADFADGGTVDAGEVTVTGLARLSEATGGFTPQPDAPNRIEYVRNIERLSRLAQVAPPPFAPVYIDLPAGDPGTLPQGGETVVEFPSNHFGYALTWFGFAILTPILLAFWLRRPRRRPSA